MNAAFRRTFLMGLLAAVSAYFAFYYYPWPRETVVDAKVNQNLFEDYETSSVREISIAKFDKDKNTIDQLSLRRKGEQWILPRFSNFVATNDIRIAEAAKSLIERTVFEKTSDEQRDHVEYGVVDPSEIGPSTSRSSVGTKVMLKDRNKKELASLIIGNQVKNDRTGLRHYVRVAGQPAVYTIDVDKGIFQTGFTAWISPNLMQLPTQETKDFLVEQIEIDNYRMDGSNPAALAKSKREPRYRANFFVAAPPLKLKFEAPDGEGGLKNIDLPAEQKQQLAQNLRYLSSLLYKDVIRKPKALAKLLTKASDKAKENDFKDLRDLGIVFKSVSSESGYEFDAAEGEISVTTNDGVTVNLLIGSLANSSATQNLGLSYNVMMVAKVNGDAIPVPEKPADVAEDSAENKTYLRDVAERDRKLASAALRVNELNQAYSKWIYIMPEEVIVALRPEISFDPTSTEFSLGQPDAESSAEEAPKKNLGPVPAANLSGEDK